MSIFKNQEPYEIRCFNRLMAARVDFRGGRKAIRDLVRLALRESPPGEAATVLRRHGMKIVDGRLWIAVNHSQVTALFKRSVWHREQWWRQLDRLPGAEKMHASDFGPHCKLRSISIPLPHPSLTFNSDEVPRNPAT